MRAAPCTSGARVGPRIRMRSHPPPRSPPSTLTVEKRRSPSRSSHGQACVRRLRDPPMLRRKARRASSAARRTRASTPPRSQAISGHKKRCWSLRDKMAGTCVLRRASYADRDISVIGLCSFDDGGWADRVLSYIAYSITRYSRLSRFSQPSNNKSNLLINLPPVLTANHATCG